MSEYNSSIQNAIVPLKRNIIICVNYYSSILLLRFAEETNNKSKEILTYNVRISDALKFKVPRNFHDKITKPSQFLKSFIPNPRQNINRLRPVQIFSCPQECSAVHRDCSIYFFNIVISMKQL